MPKSDQKKPKPSEPVPQDRSDKETAERRDDTLKRMLNTPPNPKVKGK